MKLLHINGLNCHLASILSIAAELYPASYLAYGNLWPEHSFNYDAEYRIYLSTRIFTNLTALGFCIRHLPHGTYAERKESISMLSEGEFFVVGMNNFHTPWSHVYRHFYGPHFFIAQKVSNADYPCLDPTFEKTSEHLTSEHILSHAFCLVRVQKTADLPLAFPLSETAEEVLNSHPVQLERLTAELSEIAAMRDAMRHFIGRMDAMRLNRALFARYLRETMPAVPIFDQKFLDTWESVKLGLHKIEIVRDKTPTINETTALLTELFTLECSLAKQLLASPNHTL